MPYRVVQIMLPDIQEDQNNQSGRLKCLGPKFSKKIVQGIKNFSEKIVQEPIFSGPKFQWQPHGGAVNFG